MVSDPVTIVWCRGDLLRTNVRKMTDTGDVQVRRRWRVGVGAAVLVITDHRRALLLLLLLRPDHVPDRGVMETRRGGRGLGVSL